MAGRDFPSVHVATSSAYVDNGEWNYRFLTSHHDVEECRTQNTFLLYSFGNSVFQAAYIGHTDANTLVRKKSLATSKTYDLTA